MRYAEVGLAIAIAALAAMPVSAVVVDVSFEATDGTDLSGSFSYDTASIPYGPGIAPCCETGGTLFVDRSPFSYTLNGVTRTFGGSEETAVLGPPSSGSGPEQFDLASDCCEGAPRTAFYELTL